MKDYIELKSLIEKQCYYINHDRGWHYKINLYDGSWVYVDPLDIPIDMIPEEYCQKVSEILLKEGIERVILGTQVVIEEGVVKTNKKVGKIETYERISRSSLK